MPPGVAGEVVVLEAGRDGIEQITEAMAERRDVGSVHIISHGSDGSLSLGNSKLDAYNIENYRDAIKSWQAAMTEEPDLIILDVMMPGADGLTVCRELKQNPRTKHIPVLMLTARAGKDDRDAGLEAGADDYVTKPFSPQRLVDKVNELLGVKR